MVSSMDEWIKRLYREGRREKKQLDDAATKLNAEMIERERLRSFDVCPTCGSVTDEGCSDGWHHKDEV